MELKRNRFLSATFKRGRLTILINAYSLTFKEMEVDVSCKYLIVSCGELILHARMKNIILRECIHWTRMTMKRKQNKKLNSNYMMERYLTLCQC